jgi:DnaJ-class molecular chaperone
MSITSEESGLTYEPETCAWCGGHGGTRESRCRVCGGKGAVLVRQPARVCPRCRCTGRAPEAHASACAECSGAGWAGARVEGAPGAGRRTREAFEKFWGGRERG